MSGANFILAINMVVAGLLAAAFLAIAVQDARRIAARWMAASYCIGIVYLLIELSIQSFTDARWPVVAAFAILLVAMIVFNTGLARKYDVAPPWRSMLAFLVVASAAVYLVQDLPRQSLARMMAYQLPYAAMQLIGLGIVWSSPHRKEALDRILMGVLAASALQFLSKPFIAHAVGGWGADATAYLQTTYAMVSQSLGTVFSMALALLVLVILVRDTLTEAASRSDTDSLSLLLNRGGFERRAGAVLSGAVRRGMSVSLVIADLDRFKSINDSFGHACGDKVIETFASFLHEASVERHVAGRIGGEEFAILLVGTNLAGARLLAEGTRSAFGALPVEGLPRDYRCTASFGVAELTPYESFAELMQRADHALYEAKKGGRDQVRVSAVSSIISTGARSGRDFNGRG